MRARACAGSLEQQHSSLTQRFWPCCAPVDPTGRASKPCSSLWTALPRSPAGRRRGGATRVAGRQTARPTPATPTLFASVRPGECTRVSRYARLGDGLGSSLIGHVGASACVALDPLRRSAQPPVARAMARTPCPRSVERGAGVPVARRARVCRRRPWRQEAGGPSRQRRGGLGGLGGRRGRARVVAGQHCLPRVGAGVPRRPGVPRMDRHGGRRLASLAGLRRRRWRWPGPARADPAAPQCDGRRRRGRGAPAVRLAARLRRRRVRKQRGGEPRGGACHCRLRGTRPSRALISPRRPPFPVLGCPNAFLAFPPATAACWRGGSSRRATGPPSWRRAWRESLLTRTRAWPWHPDTAGGGRAAGAAVPPRCAGRAECPDPPPHQTRLCAVAPFHSDRPVGLVHGLRAGHVILARQGRGDQQEVQMAPENPGVLTRVTVLPRPCRALVHEKKGPAPGPPESGGARAHASGGFIAASKTRRSTPFDAAAAARPAYSSMRKSNLVRNVPFIRSASLSASCIFRISGSDTCARRGPQEIDPWPQVVQQPPIPPCHSAGSGCAARRREPRQAPTPHAWRTAASGGPGPKKPGNPPHPALHPG